MSPQIPSSEFWIDGNITTVSYVQKMYFLVLSTTHEDRAVDDNSQKKKPENSSSKTEQKDE